MGGRQGVGNDPECDRRLTQGWGLRIVFVSFDRYTEKGDPVPRNTLVIMRGFCGWVPTIIVYSGNR